MPPTRATPKPGAAIVLPRWVIVLALLLFGAGGSVAIWQGIALRRVNEWPTAEGTVARSWIKVTEKRAAAPGVNPRPEIHEVMVDYTFVLHGHTYSNTGAAPRQIEEDEGETAAQAVADSFAPGSKIDVFYQLENPADNRLRRIEILSNTWLIFVVFGAWFALGSVIGIFLTFRRGARHEPSPGTPAIS